MHSNVFASVSEIMLSKPCPAEHTLFLSQEGSRMILTDAGTVFCHDEENHPGDAEVPDIIIESTVQELVEAVLSRKTTNTGGFVAKH